MKIVETTKTKLSLAVAVKDAFAPAEILKGAVALRVNGRHEPARQNRLGYWLFLDLPDGPYEVQAAGDFYSVQVLDNLGVADPLRPVLDIRLEPNASYVFPAGTTLLRGIVKKTGDTALAGVKVAVDGESRQVFTDDQGAFVLYCKNPSGDQATLKLTLTKEGFQTKKKNFNIPKGTTKVVSIVLSTRDS
ncbi:MAG: hypothetical protein EHM45_18770 [Desulfobacteraceae bacterium]|nr:MAG: hypothetical protein EHM45_18770 [Desulfobacteraceae bacterium]